ncbi:hypothetical protein [Megamonas sp.]|uniref:PTS sugar transporter subunit IIA n=1 Tax=Megamonas sp. TaxID=2049033 RepID=UPI002582A3AE|nr:hypothetical protein [Megamonas sp.]
MKYVILVSHGKFANGLNDALSMLAGNREDILSVGLENGKSVDEFTALFTEKVKDISNDDDVILLGDIIGGSPYDLTCEHLAFVKNKLVLFFYIPKF